MKRKTVENNYTSPLTICFHFHTTCPVIKYFNHAHVRPSIRKAYTGRDKSHTDMDNLLNKGHPLTCDNCWPFPKVGGDSSTGGVSDWKARCNTDTGSSPPDQWGIFHPESTASADSLTTSVQTPCAIACINIRARVKNPKHWQPHHCLDTGKYCTHW